MLARILRTLRRRKEAAIIRADRSRAAHEGKAGAGVAHRQAVRAKARQINDELHRGVDHRLADASEMVAF